MLEGMDIKNDECYWFVVYTEVINETLLLDPRLAAGDLVSMVAKSPAGYL